MIPGSVDATSDNALETRNLALTSTFVVQGTCTGVVFAIGDKTVMGRIVAMSGETKFKLTTVQREVWFFTKIVSGLALLLFVIAIVVWAAWLKKSFPGFETASGAIINSIGCLTAFVPQVFNIIIIDAYCILTSVHQGLPICVALSLTIIAKRMARRNVLVKNLATIETLGCMSVLCSDKTGTLTMGKMVRHYLCGPRHALTPLLVRSKRSLLRRSILSRRHPFQTILQGRHTRIVDCPADGGSAV